ncbi:hypothetical protein BGY98DRAFT_1180232 [Russula aff. rugulosa BPL654]|nr:hypothetical protein BGY98DRAFT_1180232 [Russula aff. rugulosa BPL654]
MAAPEICSAHLTSGGPYFWAVVIYKPQGCSDHGNQLPSVRTIAKLAQDDQNPYAAVLVA